MKTKKRPLKKVYIVMDTECIIWVIYTNKKKALVEIEEKNKELKDELEDEYDPRKRYFYMNEHYIY